MLMEQVIAFLVILSMNFAIQSSPLKNGFSVKFGASTAKEENKELKSGALFAKKTQETKFQEEMTAEVFNADIPAEEFEVESEYAHPTARLLYPTEYVYKKNIHNITKALARHWAGLNYLNLPIVRQPYEKYKVLVATAPPNVHLGGDDKQTFIYVIFPEDGTSDNGVYNVPAVYFVNGRSDKKTIAKMKSVDPILIVDNNRTVTGIKSREIAKTISFRNKLTNRFKYSIA